MKKLNINGFREVITERTDFPLDKCKTVEAFFVLLHGSPLVKGNDFQKRESFVGLGIWA